MAGFAQAAIYVGGGLHLAFVVFHLLFWRLFNWREELALLSPLNRRVVPVLNVSVVVAFLGVAYLSFTFAAELVATALGRGVCFAVAAFWLARLAQQFLFFGLRRPLSWLLSVAFLLLAAIYGLPASAVR